MVSERSKAVLGSDVNVDALVDRATAGLRGPSPALREEIRAGAVRDPLDRVIDRVVEEHRAVRGVLETQVTAALHGSGFTERIGAPSVPAQRRPWTPRDDGLTANIEADLRRVRAERDRVALDLRPTLARPVFDDAVVTRAGIFYVPPEFTQAHGIGPVGEARLAAAGYRSAQSVVRAPLAEVAAALEMSEDHARLAVNDLDITRLAGVDAHAADLLRLAGVHAISKLAVRDPDMVARDVAKIVSRHHVDRVPAVLSSGAALERLVREARELAA